MLRPQDNERRGGASASTACGTSPPTPDGVGRGRSGGGRAPLAGRPADAGAVRATTTSSSSPRCTTTSATSGTSARSTSPGAGTAGASCSASTPPPTGRWCGRTTSRWPSTRAATRPSRPTSPRWPCPASRCGSPWWSTTSSPGSRSRPGVIHDLPGGRPQAVLLPGLLQLRRADPQRLAVRHLARPTSPTSPWSPTSTAPTGRRRAGRRSSRAERRRGPGRRSATPTASVGRRGRREPRASSGSPTPRCGSRAPATSTTSRSTSSTATSWSTATTCRSASAPCGSTAPAS